MISLSNFAASAMKKSFIDFRIPCRSPPIFALALSPWPTYPKLAFDTGSDETKPDSFAAARLLLDAQVSFAVRLEVSPAVESQERAWALPVSCRAVLRPEPG